MQLRKKLKGQCIRHKENTQSDKQKDMHSRKGRKRGPNDTIAFLRQILKNQKHCMRRKQKKSGDKRWKSAAGSVQL